MKIKTDYFDFDLISKYFYNINNSKSKHHTITDKIRDDLDIDELFIRIDRTSSKIGQHFLYNKTIFLTAGCRQPYPN